MPRRLRHRMALALTKVAAFGLDHGSFQAAINMLHLAQASDHATDPVHHLRFAVDRDSHMHHDVSCGSCAQVRLAGGKRWAEG